MLVQSREVGFKGDFIGGSGVFIQSFIDMVGSQTERVYVDGARILDTPKFLADYTRDYKNNPTVFSGYSYDAARIILNAVKQSSSTERKAVLQAVRATQDFPGLGGPINFDAKGDSKTAGFVMYQVQNKKFVPVKKLVEPM